ncbi:RNA polymerase factor sigma-54 [Persicirhabdus sediminis]|nr:RNA polymerase factor sigma-54 [Persicirhabdus sediminis]
MSAIGLHQSLSQQQALSPQMRQSLEILQANTLELGQLLRQVTALNPTLEIEGDADELEYDTTVEEEYDSEVLDDLQDDWRDDWITQKGGSMSDDDIARQEHQYASIVAPITLQQHLVEQLNMSELSDHMYKVVSYLIGNINDRGFLDSNIEDLAQLGEFSWDDLQQALILIQGYDPAGVGARDLRECLLLQLNFMGLGHSIEGRIVEGHLDDLARRRYQEIARAMGVSPDAVSIAAENISFLTPDPGATFDATSNPHVSADVEFLADEEGRFYANLTDQGLPKIRISNHYKDLLSRVKNDAATQKFLKENLHESRQILHAVSQRQETLLRISSEIIKRQAGFMQKGMRYLQPMTMMDVADTLEVHAATISRAVAGKYVRTPHGLIEMRRFFTSGYTTKEGDQVSNTGVKEAIQQLVAKENPAKPLSDSGIEKALKADGIKVARRTVAKYREQLGILPSHLRKRR